MEKQEREKRITRSRSSSESRSVQTKDSQTKYSVQEQEIYKFIMELSKKTPLV